MAKKFTFSLQKVLDVRHHIENQKAVELKKAQVIHTEESARLTGFQKTKASFIQQNSGAQKINPNPNLQDLIISGNYIEQLNTQIDQQNEQVKKSEKVVIKQRKILTDAVKNKKVVEKLKERYQENFKKMIKLEENKKTDEVAIRIGLNK